MTCSDIALTYARPFLLHIAPLGALRIFRLPNPTLTAADVPEVFPAPEEVFCLPPGAHDSSEGGSNRVLAAELVSARGRIPILVVVREMGDFMELAVIDMMTGKATRETQLEASGLVKLSAGSRFTVVVSTGRNQ